MSEGGLDMEGMETDEELFNITTEESALVQKLIDEYIEDKEELGKSTGENYVDLPHDSYLDRCETENGRVCFRTNMAAGALTIFLMLEDDTSPESMEAEFLALEQHFELFETPTCQTIVSRLMVMDSLMHTSAAHMEDAKLMGKKFARNELADFLQKNSLGKPRLSATVLKFLESKS